MTTYDRKRYLRTRAELPRMQDKCDICGKKLERFGERKQIYFCSDECAKEHKKRYKKQWEIGHIEKVLAYKRKYNKKYADKKNKAAKLQKVSK
jgi:hypothetical protein